MGVKRKLTKAVRREVNIEEVFQDYLAGKKALNKSPATITSAMGSFKRWYKSLEIIEVSGDLLFYAGVLNRRLCSFCATLPGSFLRCVMEGCSEESYRKAARDEKS